MQWSWMLGWALIGVVLAWAVGRLYRRWRAWRARHAKVDLMLEDLAPPEPKPTRLGYNDETAPAISSLPPAIDHSQWDNPTWDAPDRPARSRQKPSAQRWLH